MNTVAMVIIGLVGLVHLIPVSGVLGGDHLRALYGFDGDDASLRILLRHRAVLFSVVGMLLVSAVALPGLRPVALGVGLLSMLSFIAIAGLEGGGNDAIRRVVRVDLVASLGLAVVAAYDLYRYFLDTPT